MKNTKRGFLVPLFIILLAIALGIGIYVTTKNSSRAASIPASSVATIPAGWELYTDSQIGISFEYPIAWGNVIKSIDAQGIVEITFQNEQITILDESVSDSGANVTQASYLQGIVKTDSTDSRYQVSQIQLSDATATEISTYPQNGEDYPNDYDVADMGGGIINIGPSLSINGSAALNQLLASFKVFSPAAIVQNSQFPTWKLYENSQLGVSFYYPPALTSKEATFDSVSVISDPTKIDTKGCYEVIGGSGAPNSSADSSVTLNGTAFCVSSAGDPGAGHLDTNYDYTTENAGTYVTLDYDVGTTNGCGIWEGDPTQVTEYQQCEAYFNGGYKTEVIAPLEQSAGTLKFANPSQAVAPSAPSTATSGSVSVAGMSKYTDSTYGYSFWYPSTWTLSQVANTTNTTSYLTGTTDGKIIKVFDSQGDKGFDVEEIGFPAGPVKVPDAGCDASYYYDTTSTQWMESVIDCDGQPETMPVSSDASNYHTMGGLPGLYTQAGLSTVSYIVPLDATDLQKSLLVTAFPENGDEGTNLFINTITATDPKVGIQPTQAAETQTVQAEAAFFATAVNMKKYTDASFGFSFWYPTGWVVSQEPATDPNEYTGGTVTKQLVVTNGKVSVTLEEYTSPTFTITDATGVGACPVCSPTTYSFNTSLHEWMYSLADSYGAGSGMYNGSPYVVGTSVPAIVSADSNTMGGLHMFAGSQRFGANVIIPLSARNFVVVTVDGAIASETSDPQALARTIVATDPSVGTPVSQSQQNKIIQNEATTYAQL